MLFASEIAALSPSRVKELTPTTAPPLSASFWLRASNSPSSPTHGLQVVNQKLTTVTVLFENSSSLLTSLPSRSFPLKLGNFSVPSAFDVMPALWASTLSPWLGVLPHPGNSCSRAASLSSICLICSAPVFSVSCSCAVNLSFAPSSVARRKSP